MTTPFLPPPSPPTGIGCYCGCGEDVDKYFVSSHDSKAQKYMNHLHYGGEASTAKRAVERGYGPEADDKSLKDEYDKLNEG